MHELIDREDPRCLYCNSDCDLKQDGIPISTWNPAGNIYECQTLTCRKCKEVFEIHWYDHQGSIFYSAFGFTCKEMFVLDLYPRPNDNPPEGMMFITTRKHLYSDDPRKSPMRSKSRIPPFLVDFSDKNKLYEKLKTYLIFS